MDVGEIRDLVRRPPSRATRLGIAAGLLLAVPLIWSVRQSRMTREALDRATAAEQTAAQARDDVEEARAQLRGEGRPLKDPSIRRSRHDDPREIEHVKTALRGDRGPVPGPGAGRPELRVDRFYMPKTKPAPR